MDLTLVLITLAVAGAVGWFLFSRRKRSVTIGGGRGESGGGKEVEK